MTREQLLKAMAADPEAYGLEHGHRGLTGWSASRFGGNLSMLPVTEPHVRMFDVPRFVRRVRVTVTKWIGGTHHYVRITEQDNALWLPKEFDSWRHDRLGVWWKAWDDNECRGREWEQRYTRTHFIESFVERTLAAEFAAKNIRYYLDRETLGATAYGRGGD
jgi:hypothetical protein